MPTFSPMVSDLLQPASERARPGRFLPYSRQCLDAADEQAVLQVLRSDRLTQGPQIEAFEAALAERAGARHAVAVCNGTAALHLAAQALGVETGTPAAVPAVTFAATANAVRYCGGEVAFAEVDNVSGLSTADMLEQALHLARQRGNAGRRGLLMPVSLNGRVPDLSAVAELAEQHNCDVIEDAAHSLGAAYAAGPRRFSSGCCAHSMAAILSFHPVKHICCGEGGAVLTNDAVLAEKMRALRSHGIVRPRTNGESTPSWFYDQIDLGHNYRMTEIQAALALSQLRKLPDFSMQRGRLAARYHKHLKGAPYDPIFQLPPATEGHSWHLFALRFHKESVRDRAVDWLKAQGIGTQVHYRPVHTLRYYRERYGAQHLPGAELYGQSCLSLPLFPGLTDEEQDWVIKALKHFCEEVLSTTD